MLAMIAAERAVQLALQTSLGIGGWAREYHAPATIDELSETLGRIAARREPPFVLGAGTNTLFPDGEFSRPIVSTRRLSRWEVLGDTLVAEGGVLLSRLIRLSIQHGLSGLEGLVGIPGTAGGAVMMNAGGSGWEFGEQVAELGLVPLDGGPLLRRKGSDIHWGYRTARLDGLVVAWVALRLRRDARETVLERTRSLFRRKSATQPLGSRSAGCVFRNPPGLVAAKLIEELGLKGFSRGGARISERHANFIVNADGRASAADVKSLLEEVRSRVVDTYGIRLETEIILA